MREFFLGLLLASCILLSLGLYLSRMEVEDMEHKNAELLNRVATAERLGAKW